jgi:DNA-binding NtrC family response regulator
MLRVLVADARATVQRELRQTLALTVERCGVVEAHDCDALRVRLSHGLWDVVVVDLLLPGMNGLGVFDELKRDHPHVPFLLMGEADDTNTATCCLRDPFATHN